MAGALNMETKPAQSLSMCHPRLATMHELARTAGITCLATEWKTARYSYRFRCAQGHEWQRKGGVFQQKQGCPTCGRLSKGEAGPFVAMLQLSQAAGVTCLDNKWLGVRHHYRFLCRQGHEWLRTGTQQQKRAECPECTFAAMGLAQRKPENLLRLQEMARAHGGICLTTEYKGMPGKYAFRCAAGHEWQTHAQAIFAGTWCRRCGGGGPLKVASRAATRLARLQQHAHDKGGQCLSGKYLGAEARYKFRCAKEHEWEARGINIVAGAWCQTCAFDAKRLSIEHAHEAAQAKGGRCLSDSYVNCTIKLRWLCDRGHEWQATLGSVRAGHWCKQCDAMSRINSSNSKTRRRYADAGARLLGGDD